MKRLLISLAVVLGIAVIPVVVYALRSDTRGTSLRATVGHCSPAERRHHRVACRYIDEHPTIRVNGPIDETGTPFTDALHRADRARRIDVHVDSGRYAIFLEIDHLGTIRANPRNLVDMSTGIAISARLRLPSRGSTPECPAPKTWFQASGARDEQRVPARTLDLALDAPAGHARQIVREQSREDRALRARPVVRARR